MRCFEFHIHSLQKGTVFIALYLSVCLKFSLLPMCDLYTYILCSIFAGCLDVAFLALCHCHLSLSLLARSLLCIITHKKIVFFGFFIVVFFFDYHTVLFLPLNVFFKHEHHSHARIFLFSETLDLRAIVAYYCHLLFFIAFFVLFLIL